MTKITKSISFLTAFALFMTMLLNFSFSTFGVTAKAADTTPTEPSIVNGVYQISKAGELYWFAALVNGDTNVEGVGAADTTACAKLTKDITVNGDQDKSLIKDMLNNDGTVKSGETVNSWTPIGSKANPYKGTFDGKNFTISGLYYNNTDSSTGKYVGLFGRVNGGTIKNVTVADSYINGYYYVGGVCGFNFEGTVENCHNKGTISGSGQVGGVVGENGGKVENCCNEGTISGKSMVGGVVGENMNSCTMTNCQNTGTVSGTNYVGGVVGSNNSGIVKNCYSLKNDTINTSINAIGNEAVETKGIAESITADRFASGEITYLLNGSTSAGTLAWGQTLGESGDAYPVVGSTAVVFRYCDNGTLKYSNTETADNHINDNVCTCGYINPTKPYTESDGTYQITKMSELYWFAGLVNGDSTVCDGTTVKQDTAACAKLMNNITVNNKVLEANGMPDNSKNFISWTPIGSKANKYTGTFDGNNYTISGLYYNNKDSNTGYYVGLFGYVNGGTIKNVTVADFYINGYYYVGGVCGYNYTGTMTNCENTGTVSGTNHVGGVCGYNTGTMTNCKNIGTVSGSEYVGGVCGSNYTGTMTDCENTGTVSGSRYVGGVCGSNAGTVTYCHNKGTVSGTYYVGGVCGSNTYRTNNCYNEGTVSGTYYVGGVCGSNSPTRSHSAGISICYNIGNVSGSSNVGGVCGTNNVKSTDTYTASISVCYNIGTISGSSDVGGVCGSNNAKEQIKNCYYSSDCNAEGTTLNSIAGTTKKPKTAFKSGEVCYLLNKNYEVNGDTIFGQTLSSDDYPVLYNENNMVYNCYKDCSSEYPYSNTNTGYTTKPSHNHDGADYTCTICKNSMVNINSFANPNYEVLTEDKVIDAAYEIIDGVVQDASEITIATGKNLLTVYFKLDDSFGLVNSYKLEVTNSADNSDTITAESKYKTIFANIGMAQLVSELKAGATYNITLTLYADEECNTVIRTQTLENAVTVTE